MRVFILNLRGATVVRITAAIAFFLVCLAIGVLYGLYPRRVLDSMVRRKGPRLLWPVPERVRRAILSSPYPIWHMRLVGISAFAAAAAALYKVYLLVVGK